VVGCGRTTAGFPPDFAAATIPIGILDRKPTQDDAMTTLRQTLVAVALFSAVSASAAVAQDGSESSAPLFGVRAGVGFEPSQFVAGASVTLGRALRVFRIVPVAQVGLGDHTTFDINVDFLIRLMVEDTNFGFYGGAAPTLVFGESTEFGGTLVAGLAVPLFKDRRTHIEGRFGLGNVPDVRVMMSVSL
jgi:hypothetical protein